ncbi:2-hydroxyacid dehydrogenase [Chloroflexota bacterium]
MKALILAPFHPHALDRLGKSIEVIYESWMETNRLISPEEMVERIQSQDIAVLVIEADFVFEEVFEGSDKLRFIGVCRAATNHVDLDSATEHGVLVVNTPARNAVAVAELAVGLMLSVARRIPQAHNFVKSGQWDDPVAAYLSLRGVELGGKVAGIIGLGAIGREVARRLRAFDMELLAYDPYITPEQAARSGVKQTDLDDLIKKADFITIHCPLSPETEGLISRERIGMMKPTAYLVNTAAWEVVDNEALIETLGQKDIAGAAFDVYETHPLSLESDLLKLDNIVLTPHIGGATEDTVARYSKMIVEDIERFLLGERPHNLVNSQAWKEYVP